MTLRQRVTAVTVIGVLVIVGLGGWLTYRFWRAADSSRAITTTLQQAADASRTLSTAYSDANGYVSIAVLDAALGQPSQTVVAGCGDPQACYDMSLTLAQESLTVINDSFPDDAGISAAVGASANSVIAWQAADPNKVFPLLKMGATRSAAAVTRSTEALTAYDRMTGSAIALQRLIDDRRTQQVEDFSTFASKLAWALVIAGLILLVLLLAGLAALRQWVLNPLDHLRAQLRTAATPEGRYHPIDPSGPPELEATGIDAEAMRRQLVLQLDEATAARQGLTQQGPVVAAIRAELEASDSVTVPGLSIAGVLQPAEGVLAGDWWNVMHLPDGRAAVIVTDVAGHGPAAGIGAVRLKNVIGSALATGFAPDTALEHAARAFADEEAQFATCAVMVVDPATGATTWANAGHPPPLLRRADGSPIRLDPTGPLVSGLGGTWTCRTETLYRGDLLLAWSDGLVESHNAAGDELGDDGLIALIDAAVADDAPPAEVVERVLAAARERAVDWRRDDVTLTAIARD